MDILAIGFAEREPLLVAERFDDPEAPESRFQRRIREGACAYFTTVLGPGTDAAHADHFHLDLRQRKRGYRLCQ